MAEEQVETTVYAKVPWTIPPAEVGEEPSEVSVGDPINCDESVAVWLVRSGLATREPVAEDAPAKEEVTPGEAKPSGGDKPPATPSHRRHKD